MDIADIILTIINLCITFISTYGAYKSCKYYNKSKTLAAHTSLNKALVEVAKMLNKLPEALTATNKCRQSSRGVNLERTICGIGNDLIASYNEIRECVPVECSAELANLENENDFVLYKYINEYISGEVLTEDSLDPEDFASCQKRLLTMQEYLKKKLDEIGERLK